MIIRLRLLVERHADDRYTVSVLDLPPAREPAGLASVLGPAPPPADAAPPLGARSPLAAYGDDLDLLKRKLAAAAAERIAALRPADVAGWRFHPDQRLERVEVPVKVEPSAGMGGLAAAPGADARALGAPREEIDVPFAVVVTTLPRAPHPVLVPKLALSIAVEDDPADALAAARVEVGAFLKRNRALRRLDALFALHPAPEERLDVLDVDATVRTPAQVRADESRDEERARKHRSEAALRVLESVATDLRAEAAAGKLGRSYERDEVVSEIAAFLTAAGDATEDRALLLVGPSGAGKSAALDEAVRRTQSQHGRAPIFAASGSRLVAGMSGFGQWQERCAAVVDALRDSRGVLAVGDPHELLESGQAIGFDVSIAQFLKRPIEQGHLRVIAECTGDAHAALERRDQGFAALFRVLRVPEPDRPRTLAVLEAVAAALAAAGRGRPAPDALAACHDLHARFAPYQAFPGKAIRFLHRIEGAFGAGPGRHFGRAALTRAFARATGLPEALLLDEVPLDPDAVRAFLRARVVGQDAATGLVADLVGRIKAGVADPRRPLASFLFLGPTGVGKTETAKALAEFLFGSRERLVRLDMTEYQDPGAAARLTGGGHGSGEGDLTRRVRAEPLSVVLLDEIEKADPGVFDLLLQLLGDARLTDARGQATDFRSAIVILTSNLGAELPEGTPGFGAAGARDRFLRAAEEFFRPELLNRLDAIVPFAPLSRETIGRIAAREIERALARDGLARREVKVEVAPEVAARAVDAGYDPRFGARPLKRAVERLVARPLAHWLAGLSAWPRRVRLEMGAAGPAVRALEEAPASGASDALARLTTITADLPAVLTAEELLRRLGSLRRSIGRLLRSDLALDVQDELETARREALRLARRGGRAGPRPEGTPGHARIRRLEAALDAAEAARKAAEELEDLGVAIFLEGDRASVAAMADDVARLAADIAAASFSLRASLFERPDSALVLVAPVGREESCVLDLAEAYTALATARRWGLVRFAEGRLPNPSDKLEPVWVVRECARGQEPERLDEVVRFTGAVTLLFEGENAAACMAAEAGRHRQVIVREERRCERFALVRTFGVAPAKLYDALQGLHTVAFPREKAPRGIPAALPGVVRIYDETPDGPYARDPRTGVVVRPARLADAARTVPTFAAAFLESEDGADAAASVETPAAGTGTDSQEGGR